MSFRPDSLRLKTWNYAQPGAYFMTICVQDKKCLFGEIKNGKMILNRAGQIADTAIREIPEHFPGTVLDCAVVMPNHIHAVIFLTKPGRPIRRGGIYPAQNPDQPGAINCAPTATLSDILRATKARISRQIRTFLPGFSWQRSFRDRIIRDPAEYKKIATYIFENPARWEADCFHP